MTAKEFILNLHSKVNTDAIEGLETNFHFDIEGDHGGQFTVSIKDQEVNSEEGLVGDPSCTVKVKDENLMKLLKGELNPMMAMMTGKVKISNPGEMMKYAKIFGLM